MTPTTKHKNTKLKTKKIIPQYTPPTLDKKKKILEPLPILQYFNETEKMFVILFYLKNNLLYFQINLSPVRNAPSPPFPPWNINLETMIS